MPENIHPSDDYISFSSIKNIFLDILQFIFKVFNFIISAVRRRLMLFAVCCIIGVMGSYIYYWQTPRYYDIEMIVQSNELSRRTYYEIIKSLNGLVTSQSYDNFSSQLKIDKQQSRGVLSMELTGINNEMLETDTTSKLRQAFKIKVKATNIQFAPLLQNALLDYLNNIPYAKLVKEGQKKIYLEKLEFIKQEQKKLDSLVSGYNVVVNQMKMPTTVYNNELDPAALYQHALKLDSVKEVVQTWLNNESKAILLIDGFKSPANPQSVSLKIHLIIGLLLGAALGLFLCMISALNKLL